MAAGIINLGSLQMHLLADDSQYNATMRNANALLDKTAGKMRTIGRKMTTRITLPLALIGGAAVREFAKFDDAMTQSLAIMGDVSDEMRKKMEATAETISTRSITSANELAEAYFFLASAGMDAAQSEAALATVEKFAVAGRFDMALATDLLTDAQSALGLSSKDAAKNMRGLLKVSDILVKANTLANATVQQFSEALTNRAGPAIKQYNMELEEGVAILAAYADQGLKGQEAGSMMARGVRLLIRGINENREAYEKLNIDVEQFASTGKNLTGVLDDITKATDGMGPAQKAATLELLGFQARAQDAILPLLGLTERIQGYREELLKAAGTTQEVADKQLRSFSSQLKIVWNNVRAAAREIGRILAPAVEYVGNRVKAATVWFRGLSEPVRRFLVIMAGAVAILGPLILLIGNLIIVTKLLRVAMLKAAIPAKGLMATLVANPIVLFALAIGTAAAALTVLEGKALSLDNTIGSLYKIIGTGAITVGMIIQGLVTVFKIGSRTIALAIGAIVNAGNWLYQFFKNTVGAGLELVWEGVKLGVKSMRISVETAFNFVKKAITSALGWMLRKLAEAIRKMAGLAEKAPVVGDEVSQALGKMSAAAATFSLDMDTATGNAEKKLKSLKDENDRATEAMSTKWTKFAEDAKKPIEPVFELSSIIKDIKDDAKVGGDALLEMAENMLRLQRGTTKAGKVTVDEAEIDALKKMLQTIQSVNAQISELRPTMREFFQETAGGILEMAGDPDAQALAFGNQQMISQYENRLQIIQEYGERQSEILRQISDSNLDASAEAAAKEQAIDAHKRAVMLSGLSALIGASASLLLTGGKKNFKIYKALAMGEAAMATYSAANKALNAGPVPNPAFAAAIVLMGLARVRQIAATKPGSPAMGGVGGKITGYTAKPTGEIGEFIVGGEAAETKPKVEKHYHIENVYGKVDPEFVDMIAGSMEDRAGDGRSFGFTYVED